MLLKVINEEGLTIFNSLHTYEIIRSPPKIFLYLEYVLQFSSSELDLWHLNVAAGCLEDEDLVMLLNAGGIDPSEVEEEG